MAHADGIEVEVVFSPEPGVLRQHALRLPAGSTVADALRGSGAELTAGLRCGVWGRVCEPQTVLRDRDRVELYRALLVDPKEARRLRHAAGRR